MIIIIVVKVCPLSFTSLDMIIVLSVKNLKSDIFVFHNTCSILFEFKINDKSLFSGNDSE